MKHSRTNSFNLSFCFALWYLCKGYRSQIFQFWVYLMRISGIIFTNNGAGIDYPMEYLSSPPCFSWVNRSFVLCFVDRCLSFCPFSICHCGACASSYYRFWLPLWCLQTVLHQVHSKLKDLTSVPFAQISQSKAKWQIKRISPTVFHLKDDQHRSKYSKQKID
jgi:ubiquitin-protein ligase